jgi:glutathione S-transferase
VRIVWLFEELGLPYELVRYRLGDAAMRTEEYRRLNPMGRVPTLEDGEVVLFESGAIVEYVLARHAPGRLAPAVESPEFPRYLQWLHYAEGMIMPPVNTIVVETLLLPEEKRNPVNLARAEKLLARMLDALEPALEGREHLAGEFSAADVMTGHAAIVAARRVGTEGRPNLAAYIERLQARPSLQKAWDA